MPHTLSGQPHPPSYYAATAGPFPSYPAVEGDLRVDVAVVGAGYTGLSAALTLARAGYRVAVIEAHKVGWGASGRNGGQLHPGLRQEPDWLAARLGMEATRDLLGLTDEARTYLYTLLHEHGIDCDLKDGLIGAIHKARYVASERRYVEESRLKWGLPLTFLDRSETAARLGTDVYHGAVFDPRGGHLHPLKFALGLAKAAAGAGALIFEDSRVLAITDGSVVALRTRAGAVRADHVLLAGDGYLGGLDRQADRHVMPLNNFILATAPLPEDPIPRGEAASDTRFVVNYWRVTADRRLLFGGGETYTHRFPRNIAGFVRKRMLTIYPHYHDVAIDYAWGGTLGLTTTRLPFIRRLRKNLWVAAGYSGQGLIMAPYAGHLVAEAIQGLSERFDVFAHLPAPPFPGGALLRSPTLMTAMTWFALRDRL